MQYSKDAQAVYVGGIIENAKFTCVHNLAYLVPDPVQ